MAQPWELKLCTSESSRHVWMVRGVDPPAAVCRTVGKDHRSISLCPLIQESCTGISSPYAWFKEDRAGKRCERRQKVTEPSRRYSVSKEAFSEGATRWHPGLKLGDWGVCAVHHFTEAPSGIPLGCWSRSRKCQWLDKVSLEQRWKIFQRC